MIELRCRNKHFGVLRGNVLEVKCRSQFCGAQAGVTVVLHLFDTATGELLETKYYQEPKTSKERK